jgi:hypothetical protein
MTAASGEAFAAFVPSPNTRVSEMDYAIRPECFKTDEEWRDWKHVYMRAYNARKRERKKLVSLSLVPRKRRDYDKKRRD